METTGNLAHGKGTAADIAVELGNDDAVEVGTLGKRGDHVDDVLTVMASTTIRTWSGLTARLISTASCIICSSMRRRPAVSTMTASRILSTASRIEPAGNLDRVFAITAEDRHPSRRPGWRAGRLQQDGTRRTRRAKGDPASPGQVGQFYSGSGLTQNPEDHEHDRVRGYGREQACSQWNQSSVSSSSTM